MFRKKTFLAILCCSFLISASLYSQVGINTTTPRKDLEVKGDMIISEELKIQDLKPILNNQKATFLIQDVTNKIRSMDVIGDNNAAMGYVITYKLGKRNSDWIENFNTNINTDDYTVSIISAFFNKPVQMQDSNKLPDFFTIPNYSAFEENNTWRLSVDYPAANLNNNSGIWTISLLIFPKDFVKKLPNQTVEMLGGNTQSAQSPIIN